MNVVSLTMYRCRETVSVVRYVLALALKGEISGLALCLRRANGRDEYAFTGDFKRSADARHAAAGRMYWKVNQGIDAME